MIPERRGGFDIDHQLEFSWLFDRKIGRLSTFQNSTYLASGKEGIKALAHFLAK